MKWPRHAGVPPRQAHADLPEGTYEREFGQGGFFGGATHLLHARPPTAWTHIEGPLRPRAFNLAECSGTTEHPATATPSRGPWGSPVLFHNSACEIRMLRLSGAMDHLVRDADGDLMMFVHGGAGHLFCDFGHLTYSEGDFIVLPRGTMWRLLCDVPSAFLCVESTGGPFSLPDRGLVGQHAFVDPALLMPPELDAAFEAQKDGGPRSVVVKRSGSTTTYTFGHNPLDTVGYQGDLLPFRVNWRAFRPLMSHRYHLPPSAHTTLVADRFVVCTFCPRPLETDPGALKVPFFHSNNDYDELLFYHRGDFFSRDGIAPGMVTLHPAGVPHGPHPKAFATGQVGGRKETDEVAVMVDTMDPLVPTPAVEAVERADYAYSWREPCDAEASW